MSLKLSGQRWVPAETEALPTHSWLTPKERNRETNCVMCSDLTQAARVHLRLSGPTRPRSCPRVLQRHKRAEASGGNVPSRWNKLPCNSRWTDQKRCLHRAALCVCSQNNLGPAGNWSFGKELGWKDCIILKCWCTKWKASKHEMAANIQIIFRTKLNTTHRFVTKTSEKDETTISHRRTQ